MEKLHDFLKTASPFVFAGLIGSLIHCLQYAMSLRDMLKYILVSMFVSVCVGAFAQYYFNIENELVLFALCGIAGNFSKELLNEAKKIITGIADLFKERFSKKPPHNDYND